jgi:hypothetical protein
MSQAQDLAAALDAECKNLIRQIGWKFQECARLVERAMAEHLAGNLPEARILLNEALDIECDVTGDTVILSPLAEEWDVDYERDQRK